MVETNVLRIAQKSSGMGLFGFLTYGFLSLFIFLLICNTIYIGLQEKSFTPMLTNLGNTFLLSTQHISEISKEITQQGGAYVRTTDFWSGVGSYIWMYAKLFLYLYTIYGWLWLIMLILEWSPLYTGGHKFTVLLLAFGIFFVLQALILLGNAGIAKEIGCFSGCDKSVIYYFTLPVMWLKDLFVALPYIIKPGRQLANTFIGNTTIY